MRSRHPHDAAATASTPPESSCGVRRIPVFVIVAAALIMSTLDATIVATALDSLQKDLGASINWVGWTITAYALGLVLMLPLSGKFSQRYGPRKVFLGSVGAFTAASLACGFATNIYMLIALRAVEAAGGAGFTPSATAIIVDHFGDARDRAVGLFGSLFAAGAMIGPVFGGLFVTYWSWRGIFWVNVPIGVAVIIFALRYVPQDRQRSALSRVQSDLWGMAFLGVGLFAGMFAVSYLGERHAVFLSATFLIPLAAAVVALWAFFRHVNRSTHPFIAPRLIHGQGFGAVNLLNTIYTGIPIGAVALIPLYAANRYDIDPLRAGTLLVAQGAANILLSIMGTILIRRTGYRLPMYAGGAIIVAGLVLLALGPLAGIPAYAWLAGSAFIVGIGAGALSPPSRNAGLQLAPEESSTIAALRTICINMGAITTVDAVTAILASARHPSVAQSWTYVGAAAILVAALPLVHHIPEHHGSW